jgi:hypothetical protein
MCLGPFWEVGAAEKKIQTVITFDASFFMSSWAKNNFNCFLKTP